MELTWNLTGEILDEIYEDEGGEGFGEIVSISNDGLILPIGATYA